MCIRDSIKTEPCVQHNNAVSQISKGDNSTIETFLNKNYLNTSINENVGCVTEGNEIIKGDKTKNKKQGPKNANNITKLNKFTNLTDKKNKSKAREEKSNSRDNSNNKSYRKKYNTTFSEDCKQEYNKERHKNKPVKIQKKKLSKSPNKPKPETSRSKSPNFNTNSNYRENPPEKMNNIVYTTEFLTYLSTHNKMPYSTKKTRFHYTPIKNNLKTVQLNRENSGTNLASEREDFKLKDYSGPIDLGCCFQIDVEVLIKNLLKVLAKLRIIYIMKNNQSLRCNKEGIKFRIDFYTLKETKLSYVKFQRTQGTTFEFQQIISKILYDLRMTV